jgi:hypothetical protein
MNHAHRSALLLVTSATCHCNHAGTLDGVDFASVEGARRVLQQALECQSRHMAVLGKMRTYWLDIGRDTNHRRGLYDRRSHWRPAMVLVRFDIRSGNFSRCPVGSMGLLSIVGEYLLMG